MDCLSKVKKQYRHRKVLILGLGLQGGGLAAIDFFTKIGCEIKVSDLKNASQLQSTLLKLKQKYPHLKYELGQHSSKFIKWADTIVRNPGVNQTAPVLKLARKLKKEIILPSAFFLKHCTLNSIGITGTRGKSTTTNLIYNLLNKHGNVPTHLAGNLPEHSAFKLFNQVKPGDLLIMELSSWELQGFRDLRIAPHLAILTNIYPDHLNYYANMSQYIDDKMQILANQKPDDFFLTLESTYYQYQPQIKRYLRSKLLLVKSDYYTHKPKFLLGQHNLENASLALRVAQLYGISDQNAYTVIQNFKTLQFRLQNLGTIKGINFFNDSTSTTPIAGIKAIEALRSNFSKQKIILICGGKEKKLPYSQWLQTVNQSCERIFLLPGSFSDQIETKLTPKTTQVPDLITLFKELIPNLTPDHVVLFSPAATSFASFNNEFDRGQQFSQQFKINQSRYGS